MYSRFGICSVILVLWLSYYNVSVYYFLIKVGNLYVFEKIFRNRKRGSIVRV